MRRAPEETDQISFSPISRYARGGTERVRVFPGARSEVRSHANSHRPGKFSCPKVESRQPSVKILYFRVVKSGTVSGEYESEKQRTRVLQLNWILETTNQLSKWWPWMRMILTASQTLRRMWWMRWKGISCQNVAEPGCG